MKKLPWLKWEVLITAQFTLGHPSLGHGCFLALQLQRGKAGNSLSLRIHPLIPALVALLPPCVLLSLYGNLGTLQCVPKSAVTLTAMIWRASSLQESSREYRTSLDHLSLTQLQEDLNTVKCFWFITWISLRSLYFFKGYL